MAKRSVLGSDPFSRPSPAAPEGPKAERLFTPRARLAKAKGPAKAAGGEAPAAKPARAGKTERPGKRAPVRKPAAAAARAPGAPPSEADKTIAAVLAGFEDQLREAIQSAGGEERLKSVEPELTRTLRGLETKLEAALRRTGVARPAGAEPAARERAEGLGGLLSLLSPRFHLANLNRYQLRNRSEEVDEFGLDPIYEEETLPLFEALYRNYFRVEAGGFEHLPNAGPGLIVANHSGVLPYDAAMIKMAVRLEHPSKRMVRPLIEDFAFHFPFLGPIVARLGGVRACQENAQRLIEGGWLAAVFPEGIKGNVKPYSQRYQLQRFGRGGFIKLCMLTGAPLIPTAVVGAEEIHPVIARADWFGKLFLGLPAFPITPTMPWLGPLGLLPLPSKWSIQFGEPIDLSRYGPEAVEDQILVNRLTLDVREIIQEMIKDLLKERRSPYFG